MEILAKCPACDAALPVQASDAPPTIACGRCGHAIALLFTDLVQRDESVDRCPVCRGPDFYIRKDFDPKVGLTVVIIGALISAGFYWFGLDLVAYAVLAGAVAVDFMIYRRLADMTVCYRCHSEFRGEYRRTARAFDLHTADVLEREYERQIGRR